MPAIIQRESKEFLAVPILVEGVPLGADPTVWFCVTAVNERPTDAGWFPSITLSGRTGFLVSPGDYAVGQWQVWFKVTGVDPEVPVRLAGKFTIA